MRHKKLFPIKIMKAMIKNLLIIICKIQVCIIIQFTIIIALSVIIKINNLIKKIGKR
jgi:hypothetical protein